MTASREVFVREGRLQAGAALGLAMVLAATIATPTWPDAQTAGRLAIVGVVLLAAALVIGSARLVGLTTLPILGSALVASVAAEDPAWVRSIVVGILWYVVAELAWDAIERRDRVRRTTAFRDRRIDETTTVILVTFAAAGLGLLASSQAPVRTAFALGPIIIGLLVALVVTTRHLRRTAGGEQGPAEHGAAGKGERRTR